MAIPDADIYPSATGNALETVRQHQKEEDLVFYAGWFCPFVQRTWIALEEKGVPYQYKEENPYHKDKEFLRISPKGLVPAVVYKGRPIHESLVINEFLEDAFPDTKPLLPRDPYSRAQVRLAIDHVTKYFLPNFFKLLQSQDKAGQEVALQAVYDALNGFAARFVGQGPLFAGSELSLADLALLPWVGRFHIVEKYRGFSLSETDPKFQAWAEHVRSLEAFKKTTSDSQHYEPIYGRYLRNEAQSEAAKATRAGTVIP
ncbi:glutathione-S-transferase [Ramaria rubella]|nr:glutathione-S-transferase [Ramaria rubella]